MNMNRAAVLAALQTSGAQLTTRQDFWITRLLDTFTDSYLRFWTTIKPFPWSRVIYIAHPVGLRDHADAWKIIAHELVHVKQWKELGWWRMVARYATQSGRLALEAPAYAVSIVVGHYTLDHAAWILKRAYLLGDYTMDQIAAALQYEVDRLES